MSTVIALLLAGTALPSNPDLGKAQGQCHAHEAGPAFLVSVEGLKDRKGRLKLELYPANDSDFLQDDNILISEGKPFARVEVQIPQRGPVELCIRAAHPGSYALSLLHDRDENRKFGVSSDGIGFAGNPRLGWSKPRAAAASARVGPGPTRLSIILNYRRGLLSFGPLRN